MTDQGCYEFSMQTESVIEKIVRAFDRMSGQLQTAARYILESPHEVALLSMREQARQAGVQPATMTRLAKHLGFSGYDDIRRFYADAMRNDATGFAGRVDAQARNQKLKGDLALAADMLDGAARQMAALGQSAELARMLEAVDRICDASRIYCLGLRSSYPVAWYLHYKLSLAGKEAIMLYAIAGIGADVLGHATADDTLVAVSVAPYTRQTVETADYARSCGVPVIAITDSPVSPLAQLATTALIVPTDSPSFLHTLTPAFIVAEILGALVAGRNSETSGQALTRMDRQSAALNTHLTPRHPPGRSTDNKNERP